MYVGLDVCLMVVYVWMLCMFEVLNKMNFLDYLLFKFRGRNSFKGGGL